MSRCTSFSIVDDYKIKLQEAKITLGFSPTADVVEVVRCCDCKHSKVIFESVSTESWHCKKAYGLPNVDPYGFCSCGERYEQ